LEEDGYQEDISIRETYLKSKARVRVRIFLREFIAFRIQQRSSEFGNIVNACQFFQQFLVDYYTMIEAQYLSFTRPNQKLIRYDILKRGETNPSSIGRRTVFPASFTSGTRYMFNNCQDVMAICKKFEYLDLVITITCNVNWSEIRDFVSPRSLSASDKPDIVCRVFKMKLDQMMTDFKK